MIRPLRLAYLSLETPRPGQASQTHITEMAASLEACGWDVELFATTQGGASADRSFLRRLFDYVGVQSELAFRLDEFDALFIRSHFMALPLAILAKRRRVPTVHEINGTAADIGVTYPALRSVLPIFLWLYRAQYRTATRLIAVTPGLADWAKQVAGHERVGIVSNGANVRMFRPDGPEIDIAHRYVIFVGGLVAWHGVDTMLSALRNPAWPADVHLVIVGDGVERGKVEAAMGDSRLHWLGRQPYEAIPAMLRGAIASLCVIEDRDGRSSSGVAPLKMFEAMACGVPVIASDLPFQAQIVAGNEAGLIVPTATPASLAAAVRTLAEAPELAKAMGARGADFVAREASWDHRGREVDHFLKAALRDEESI